MFMVSVVSGSLWSATLDPFNVSVGASGGIFGLMGGCIAYVIGRLREDVVGLQL